MDKFSAFQLNNYYLSKKKFDKNYYKTKLCNLHIKNNSRTETSKNKETKSLSIEW